MAKLNQIIAVEKGVKSRAYSEIGDLHKAVKKPELFGGFAKEYQKKNEEDDDLPGERKRVSFTVAGVLKEVERKTSELLNVTARKDWTNQSANADVVINGKVLIAAAPVSYLLFLEKQMNDLRAIAADLPVLDNGETWTKDENSGLYKTEAAKTQRTKKVQKPIVLYPATPEHPAQTQMVTEDIIAGFWSTVKQSGAMPAPEKAALIERIDVLTQAVKFAREKANSIDEVTAPDVGNEVFSYLMAE